MEKPYPAPADPHKIIKSLEWLNEDVVQTMQKQYVYFLIFFSISPILYTKKYMTGQQTKRPFE